jgi:hypothetical protein
MAYYEQPPYQQPTIPQQPQQPPMDQIASAYDKPMTEDPGPTLPEAPPPNIPPPPSSSPLALTGSFAQPGTSGAKAFRTAGFFAPERLVGVGGPIRFGQGQGLGFGKSGITDPNSGGRPGEGDDERLRAVLGAGITRSPFSFRR